MFGFKRRRRAKVKAEPFPGEWEEILQEELPYWALLDDAERAELKGHVQVLLDEKRFEGAGGLEMTDRIRVSIAGQAGVLLLGDDHDYFPLLRSIVVHPAPFLSQVTEIGITGQPETREVLRSGESWGRGTVVLAWSSVLEGAASPHDARNVVFHEFAHQLDSMAPLSRGAPKLPDRRMYPLWAEHMGEAYRQLLDDLEHHRRTILDDYAATDAAEFFAVVTETFFERPNTLKKAYPEVYDLLARFYTQDPGRRTSR